MPFTVWPSAAYGTNLAPGTWPARYAESVRSTTSTTTDRSVRFFASQSVLTRSEASGAGREEAAPITAISAIAPAKAAILRETNGIRLPVEIKPEVSVTQPGDSRGR